jgi:hypothetical protein
MLNVGKGKGMENSINGYTLGAIKEICEKATPAPWVLFTSDSGCPEYIGTEEDYDAICETDQGCYGPSREDAAFIIMARRVLPALLELIND